MAASVPPTCWYSYSPSSSDRTSDSQDQGGTSFPSKEPNHPEPDFVFIPTPQQYRKLKEDEQKQKVIQVFRDTFKDQFLTSSKLPHHFHSRLRPFSPNALRPSSGSIGSISKKGDSVSSIDRTYTPSAAGCSQSIFCSIF